MELHYTESIATGEVEINSGLLTLQTDSEEERTLAMGPGTLTFAAYGGSGGYTPVHPYSFKVREPETRGERGDLYDFILEPTLDSLRTILAQK